MEEDTFNIVTTSLRRYLRNTLGTTRGALNIVC
jgi:hypothetical protein